MSEKRFPIIGTQPKQYIPWDLVEPYRDQAMKNHGQTLERLAQRGGLAWIELFAISTGSSWRDMNDWTRPRQQPTP